MQKWQMNAEKLKINVEKRRYHDFCAPIAIVAQLM
jgi:hypothetical protein